MHFVYSESRQPLFDMTDPQSSNSPLVHLRLACRADLGTLQALWRAHLLVLGGFNPTVDAASALDEQWFDRPGVLFPWLIEVDGVPAGFALIGNRQLAAAMGVDADFYLHEFHVSDGQRRRGLGRAAVEQLRRLHPGSWALLALAANAPALRFWSTALPGSSQVDWTGEEGARYVRFLNRP